VAQAAHIDRIRSMRPASDCPHTRRGERQHIVLHDQPALGYYVTAGGFEIRPLTVAPKVISFPAGVASEG
jgi:hypothetical protein